MPSPPPDTPPPGPPARRKRSATDGWRILAGGLGAVAIVGCVIAVPFVLFIVALGASVPNPYLPDGDPCCTTADTWAETFEGAGGGLIVAAVYGLAWTVTASLLWFGFRGDAPRLRWVLLTPPAFVVGAAALLGLWMAFAADQARTVPNCERFRFSAADWRSSNEKAWQQQALGLDDCGTLRGQTREQVVARLGPPPGRPSPRSTVWRYRDGTVAVRFGASGSGRVRDIETSPLAWFS